MEYLISLILALAVAALASAVGFDRERSFYATVLIVVASYYALFAVMGSSHVMGSSQRTLVIEGVAASAFLLLAVLGFKRNYWLIVAAFVAHGIFDFVHHSIIENSGVPSWWPGFCLAFDVAAGGLIAVRLLTQPKTSLTHTGPGISKT
jgi:hypothetical protein